jgi:hypothetical protein
MATNSVQYDNYLDLTTLGAGFANRAGYVNAKLRASQFHLETSASAAGTTVNLTIVPAGAIYLCTLLIFEATASLTLDIGDSGDADRLVAAADLGTADSPTTGSVCKIFTRTDSTAFGVLGPDGNQSSAVSVGLGYIYTAKTVITGLTAGATATAGEVIRGAVIYTIE